MIYVCSNSIPPTTTLENLRVKASAAREEVFVDVGFWGGIVPGNEVNYYLVFKLLMHTYVYNQAYTYGFPRIKL